MCIFLDNFMFGIYKITNKINNKFYIGSATNVSKRWKRHVSDLNKQIHCNYHLQRAWDKYGEENFVFEVIEEVLEKSHLSDCEQHYLDMLNPEYNILKDTGFSRTGILHTDETKKKMRKSHEGKHTGEDNGMHGMVGELNRFYGKKHTEESKQKMREAAIGRPSSMKGKKFSEESRKKLSDSMKKAHREGRVFSWSYTYNNHRNKENAGENRG